jgi:hypothetical protein
MTVVIIVGTKVVVDLVNNLVTNILRCCKLRPRVNSLATGMTYNSFRYYKPGL